MRKINTCNWQALCLKSDYPSTSYQLISTLSLAWLEMNWKLIGKFFLIFSEPFLSIIIALYSVIVLCGGGSRNNISDFNQKYFSQFSETSWWCSPLSSPRRWGPRGTSSSSVSPSRTSCSPSPSPPPSTTPSPRPGRCRPTSTFAGQNTGDKDQLITSLSLRCL